MEKIRLCIEKLNRMNGAFQRKMKKKNTKINILDTYLLHTYVDRDMWEIVYAIRTYVYCELCVYFVLGLLKNCVVHTTSSADPLSNRLFQTIHE